ncbi:helicase [Planomonospora parontospora subsp. parontospora]|uniref:Helicase n=2 Tax=Planomonospora parontospora TaxID=58119 RepID=A0AA37BG24_9ACTN|nr:DEAD/DEAH box helicase [Planomonospora parontospora]GGK65751.1 helicase [Planomonospora parontospora]GII08398.1 helicase [Planomonospora parontospora subsp. parontospora]
MRPTLAAEELRGSLTQYLTTTFALADRPVREALKRFLNHPEQGIFRGPYLRIRTPFRTADDGWAKVLEWAPAGFTPYRHQAKAFERLSTLGKRAEPTLITTGTGSGKTESFLVPVLDHCRRERAGGKGGVKAVLLYPMNALATDQAHRINDYLQQSDLHDVTAALYIGDTPEVGYPKVMTERSEIRRNPPDVLITNYKMLDLLLQRPDDLPLWQDAEIAYVVVDEFHTYDGAQGTDVAVLLRRLAAATGHSRPGRPLGDICPVATSATLGENGPATGAPAAPGYGATGTGTADGTGNGNGGGPGRDIRAVAEMVFGTPFPADAVVGEDRLTVEEFVGDIDVTLPLPGPDDLIACGDPLRDPGAMEQLATAVTGQAGLDPQKLGAVLRRHILTQAVLDVLGGQPRTFDEMLDLLPRRGAYNWGAAIRDNPARAATALARFVALLSHARDPEDDKDLGKRPRRPFLLVETHMWVRAVSRLLRLANHIPAFAWIGEQPVVDADSAFNPLGKTLLPAVYCRHCGRSGWAALSPERDPAELVTAPEKIYRAGVGAEKKRVRPLVQATRSEVEAQVQGLAVLDEERVRPYDPGRDAYGEGDIVFVLTDLRTTPEALNAAEQDRCPACDMDEGIRFLGSGLASLASVVVTQLFAGGQLEPEQRKTLLFNDSVQDAAHRAGFVANRSYTFSLRRLLTSRLDEEAPILLNDLIGDLAAAASEAGVLPAVVPPDLHDRPEIDAILAGETTGGVEAWDLIGERLAFAAVMELGLRSRQGRTLELTRTAAAEVVLADPARVAALARDAHTATSGMVELRGDERYLVFVRGLLERLRYRGAVKHAWLEAWLGNAGTSRYNAIWGRRPDGMPAFPRGVGAPTFLLDRLKRKSEFDRVDAEQGWPQDWAARCLGLTRGQAGEYLSRLLPLLTAEGVIAKRTAADGSTGVYGLRPGHIQVHLLGDDQVDDAGLGCDRCAWQQTLPPHLVADWYGQPCPRYRCGGSLTDRGTRDHRADYYRRLYRGEGVFRVVTAEHTGALTRSQREQTEQRFREGNRYSDPNVLSCTPTLELGIDIGELSAVILASLPPGPANYVQRVGRAGRRTGNAFLVTMVGRSPRDLYFLDEPRDMIAGEIVPPGSYLSAVEILHRQYAAHLVDLCARDRLGGVPALPRRASVLFGETGWLAALTAAALASGTALADGFLDLFGDAVSEAAADDLRAFATGGLEQAVKAAEKVWNRRLDDLRERLKVIDAATGTLVESDPSQHAIKRSLAAERRAVARLIGETGRQNAQGALVELGLLPNYSLIDAATALEATITWDEELQGGRQYHSEVREYKRPARLALIELAPGNFFYMRGYQHEITGLDIGTPSRPAWEEWRVCPGCGHVRTERAATDTSPCPRCDGRDIGELGSLHKVLKPTRVTAHDRRDEVQIRDDSDDRRRRYYETAVAVDVDPADIAAGSWRHATAVFGVDFTRRAVIRRFNLGTTRFDRPAGDRFAGETVRLNPFHTCPSCGGTTVDGPPASGESDGLVATSSSDRSRSHHRPWCPFRRAARDTDYLKLILAHELHTEALRILLPVATLMVEQRTASFRAALMAGVAARYGGDPDHLDIVTATMPDPATGRERRFLVLHDTLPGGTGYLHRLSTPEEFRRVLEEARWIVAGCRCKEERDKRTCHRCLLSHVPGNLYDKVSRADALDMLDELLEKWEHTPVTTTADISLWDQVESELEAQFLGALEVWARRADTRAALARGEVVDGRKTADLRLEGPDGTIRHWRMILQNTIKGTRPDVLFRLVDDEPQEVAVYLDGYTYHASAQINRLADDAAKRARLRAHGRLVFQLTWENLKEWEKRGFAPDTSVEPLRPPYMGNAQDRARRFYRSSEPERDVAELVRTMWTNPVETLLAYLREPDRRLWLHRAGAVTGGLVQVLRSRSTCDADGVAERVAASLRGEDLPSDTTGRITVCSTADLAGCPVTVVLDQRHEKPAWSAFTVVDDRNETITADEETHRRRWAAWLYWGNLLQFLDAGSGDGGQFARTDLDLFDPVQLAAADGDGFLTVLSRLPLDEDLADVTVFVPRPPAVDGEAVRPVPEEKASGEAVEKAVPADWGEVLDLLDPEDTALAHLAHLLAESGVPAPEAGYELGEQAWQAEMAWPKVKVAVMLAGDDDEARKRDAAYAQAGWDVRIAKGWMPGELVERVGGPGE